MSDTHESDDTIREELVAYLDGELSPEEARAVEERLSRDERYRREMQGFDRAWNALEELPQVSVDDSFTKTTIEMVAVAAQKDLAQQTQAIPMVRRKRTLWIAGLVAVAATLGFALARIALDRPDRVLLANLPLVQHLDAYSQNLSPEFLVALQTQAGDILEPYRDEELEHQLQALQETEAASTAERRGLVEAMSDGEKAALQANYIRFEQLPHERRVQLVDLYKELSDGKNSEELQRNMLAYWAWLQDRRDAGPVQADLRKAESLKDRLALMRRFDRGQRRPDTLSAEDAKKLRAAAKSIAQDPKFRATTQRLLAAQLRRWEQEDRNGRWRGRDSAAPFWSLYWATRRPAEELTDDEQKLKDYWEEIQRKLLDALSAETRATVSGAEAPSIQLLAHVSRAVRQGERPSEEELEQFFASGELSAERVQELLALPREEMLRRLRWEYLQNEFGEDGPWSRRGRGPRGDRFDDRDDRRDGRDGRRRGDGHPDDDRDRGSNGRERRPNGLPRGDGPPRDGPAPPAEESTAASRTRMSHDLP